jgi:hypothetical protein
MMLIVIGFHFDSLRKVLFWVGGGGRWRRRTSLKEDKLFLHQKSFYFKIILFKKIFSLEWETEAKGWFDKFY